jgi:hypothetical protein
MTRRRRLRALATLAFVLGTPACILSGEDCGVGYAFEDGRCVAVVESDGGQFDDLGAAFDFGAPDARTPVDAEAPAPLDAALPGTDPWTPHYTALIVDRTPDSLLGESPSTPGCDLDGVRVLGDGLDAVAVKVLSSLVFDPFDQSIGRDENASVGAPEQTGAPGTFVSLGGGGAYQLLYLQLPRPLRRGDRVVVAEYLEPRDFGDVCALWLCSTDFVDLSACRWVGEGRGGSFVLQ